MKGEKLNWLGVAAIIIGAAAVLYVSFAAVRKPKAARRQMTVSNTRT